MVVDIWWFLYYAVTFLAAVAVVGGASVLLYLEASGYFNERKNENEEDVDGYP